MRVGLVGDTHVPEAALDLPPEAYEMLAGCDRILHCGDLHTIDVVDRLERLAPTTVARGNGDTYGPRAGRPGVDEDPRVVDTVVFEVDGFRVGMTHDLEHAEGRSDVAAADVLERCFGERVDIAVSGHTHVPMVWGLADGTAWVNPGSPTMPYGYLDILGTVGYLDVAPERFEISVVDLATHTAQLVLVGPSARPIEYGPRPSGGR
jgi:putative phosphoesterase